MFRRTLARDSVLWWRGDAAETLGVLEKGKVGIRTPQGILDVAVPGSVVGEAALLSLDGPTSHRTADVVVMEDDTVVVEYPVKDVVAAFDPALTKMIVRTLVGQIGRNYLLVAASQPDSTWVQAMVSTTVQALRAAIQVSPKIKDGADLRVAFRMLFHMREGSDSMRQSLAPPERWTVETALSVLRSIDEQIEAAEMFDAIADFIRATSGRTAKE